jgi:hypothetical protein
VSIGQGRDQCVRSARAVARPSRIGVGVLCLLLVVVTAAACSTQPPATGTPNAASARTADQIIRATNLADAASIDALARVRFDTGAVAAAATILAEHPVGNLLWAATWVYASAGTDPGVLRPLLADADPTIRLLAASALVAMGDRSGFAVISASLGRADGVTGSQPRVSIGAFAASRLERYVVAADVPAPPETTEDADSLGGRWVAWLRDHDSALRFDAGRGTWTVP